MIVFVINCGSSSLKYQLIDMTKETVMAKGLIERIGMDGSVLKHSPADKDTVEMTPSIPDHKVAIQLVIDALIDENHGVIKKMSEINATTLFTLSEIPPVPSGVTSLDVSNIGSSPNFSKK